MFRLFNILTIIIPCKNEGLQVYETLTALNRQKGIHGVKVIIADSSDYKQHNELWMVAEKLNSFSNLKIEVIDGGYPSSARCKAAFLLLEEKNNYWTRYLLFLDADMVLKDNDLLYNIIYNYAGDFDLCTIPFRTHWRYDWCYRIFDLIQYIGLKIGQPFAIGGFQLWDTNAYFKTGGYNPEHLVCEDYAISMKVDPKRFMVYKSFNGIYTSARRFKNKGILYMIKLMYKASKNRNNPDFFKKDHNYWS